MALRRPGFLAHGAEAAALAGAADRVVGCAEAGKDGGIPVSASALKASAGPCSMSAMAMAPWASAWLMASFRREVSTNPHSTSMATRVTRPGVNQAAFGAAATSSAASFAVGEAAGMGVG